MKIKISDAERIVMEVLWQSSPLTADEVVTVTAKDNEWEHSTVRTLLNRLLKKQAISAKRVNRKYLYSPLVRKDAFLRAESDSFLNRLFDGKLAPFISQLSRDNKLSDQDITELERLIEEVKDGE